MNKHLIIAVSISLIVGGIGGFFISKKMTPRNTFSFNQGGGSVTFSAEGGRQFRAQGIAGQGGSRVSAGGGVVVGEILLKDASSVTVELEDGGSKIVFFSGSTTVMKTSTGSFADLVVGENIIVTGALNQDGSVSAQSVQIRRPGQGGFMMRM